MCQPAPVATQAWTDTLARWPGVTFLGIVGDQAHQTRRSSHNCAPMQESGAYDPNFAHALDVGHGGDRVLATAIRTAFLADPRVRYVIDNGVGYYGDDYSPGAFRRVWDAVRRVFTRTGPRTFRSSGHTTHVHVSFLPGTTHDTRPFHDTQGGFGTMTDQQILDEFANVTKRTGAQLEAAVGELREQAQRHNENRRKRDEQIIDLLERIAVKLGA